jgi:hypothetical protein
MSLNAPRLAALLLLLVSGAARAGSIIGTARDVDTRKPLSGVTMTASAQQGISVGQDLLRSMPPLLTH